MATNLPTTMVHLLHMVLLNMPIPAINNPRTHKERPRAINLNNKDMPPILLLPAISNHKLHPINTPKLHPLLIKRLISHMAQYKWGIKHLNNTNNLMALPPWLQDPLQVHINHLWLHTLNKQHIPRQVLQ